MKILDTFLMSDCFCSDEIRSDDGNTDDDYHYRYLSRLNVTAEKSGIYECEVCRKFDPDNESAKLTCNR